ncbi:MAG: formate dehydrogenase accessory protein FdhE, partial [Calditrichaeota bacterium]|nr:formate dehydrogenase accessory protein FdhE [Calditrichota bacterium]
ADFVDLQEALFRFRNEEMERENLSGELALPEVDEEALSRGKCLATQVSLIPPSKLLHQSFRHLLDVLATQSKLPSSFRQWAEGSALANGLLEDWLRAATESNALRLTSLAQETEQDEDLLRWVGRELAKPFFHRHGRALSKKHLSLWHRGECPCCGGFPRMARLEKETGRRHLWCDLCNVEWPFVRLPCPFCGNDDAEKLGFLEIEGQKIYRITVCKACNGYLRTMDERQLPEGVFADMMLEDVAAFPLDFVARREGYR